VLDRDIAIPIVYPEICFDVFKLVSFKKTRHSDQGGAQNTAPSIFLKVHRISPFGGWVVGTWSSFSQQAATHQICLSDWFWNTCHAQRSTNLHGS
jgi:hypothetical protein